MDKIEMPITGRKVKLAKTDFPKPMTWKDANEAVKSLGKGWRLPTMAELDVIKNHIDEIGGFCGLENFREILDSRSDFKQYWSGDLLDGKLDWAHYADFSKDESGKFWSFSLDDYSPTHVLVKKKVRAVKSTR
jgi:hypothetical protein